MHPPQTKDKVGIYFADPVFDPAAMREKRFVFEADSPALRLGIQPLDLQDVGSSLAKADSQ